MNDTVATEDQEQPATPHERKARSHDRDPDSRTPSRPADICSASTGRTYDRSRPNRSKRQNSACHGGPSTYDHIPLSARALPHLRPRHRRTSHPVAAYRGRHQNSSYSRSSGSERAEPILMTASRSQDVMRSARRDPARISFPRGWRGSPLTLRAGIRPLSTQPPPALLPVSRSARGRLAACGPAQQS